MKSLLVRQTVSSPVRAAMSAPMASAEDSSGHSTTSGRPDFSARAAARCALQTGGKPVTSAGKPPPSPGRGMEAASGISKNDVKSFSFFIARSIPPFHRKFNRNAPHMPRSFHPSPPPGQVFIY